MNFNFKNIFGHPKSSLFGLAVGAVISSVLFYMVTKKMATLTEAMPVLMLIVPFLLFGKGKSKEDE